METSTDEPRFTEIYRQHYGAVDAYVRRRFHPDFAADLVAEIFLVVWRRLGEVPCGAELPWLYGVARNALANAYRSHERRLRLAEMLAAQPRHDVRDHSEAVAQQLAIATAFDSLSGNDQEILRLVLWDQLPFSEAARALGCTVPTAQVRLHRARKRLRRRLEAVADDGLASSSISTPRRGRAEWDSADA